MKALFTLKSAISKVRAMPATTLLALIPVIFPHLALGASLQTAGEKTAIVFEINDSSKVLNTELTFEEENQIELAKITDLENSDVLCSQLKIYLEKHNSPLKEYACEMIKQPQWQRALAISWVESNFGRRCADNNCSGIGVEPGHPAWRRYKTKLDWFKDMCQLMEKPIYKEKYTTFEKMRGIYVYPGSANWVNGAKSKYKDLMKITQEAENARQDLAEQTQNNTEIHTFPQLALLTR